ncbi:hypothetical protein [Kitasatospora azatica]|uniref:hypothetical protein n=1 Tax=Kitasatospora azatica TaxID=58347 RepID=UPI000A5F1171|nr:hypothetical protein [Kitasatospora azatica]
MEELIPEGSTEHFAIAERVFAQLMLMRFTPDQPVRDISDFVAAVRGVMAHPEAIGRLEAEALIRHALGEQTVWLAGIDAQQAGTVYGGLSVRVIQEKRLSEGAVRRLVVEAEGWAEANGIRLVVAE